MWVCACECKDRLRPEATELPVAGVTGRCDHLIWVLGTELGSFVRARGYPNCSSPLISFLPFVSLTHTG